MKSIVRGFILLIVGLTIAGCQNNAGRALPDPAQTEDGERQQTEEPPSGIQPETVHSSPTAPAPPAGTLLSKFSMQAYSCDIRSTHSRPVQTLEFQLPDATQRPLSGIQAVSTRKLYDDAGYGYAFGGSLALSKDGRVYAWGQRFGSCDAKHSPYPLVVEGLPQIKAVAGEFALASKGDVWFMNGGNQPYQIQGLPPVQAITQISEDTLGAVTTTGQLWLWAPKLEDREDTLVHVDQAGQIKGAYGDLHGIYWIDRNDQVWHAAVNWPLTVSDIRSIALPEQEAAARIDTTFGDDYIFTKDGGIYRHSSYEPDTLEPVPLKQVKQIAGTSDARFFLKTDGTVWGSWTNARLFGEFSGDESTLEKQPVQIKGLPPIVQMEMGTDHILALSRDGAVYSWGSNMYGQLGRYPHYFEQFTPIAKLQGINDVKAFNDELRFILNGDVWTTDSRLHTAPVLLDHQISRLLGQDYLSSDGALLLQTGSDTCFRLNAEEGAIREAVRDNPDGWIVKLDSGTLYKLEMVHDSITKVLPVQFPNDAQPGIRTVQGYPLLTVLSEDGRIYIKQKQTGEAVVMAAIPDLPVIKEWSTLDYVYFDGHATVARALDDQGNAYSVTIKLTYDENRQQLTDSRFELHRLADNIKHIYGSLLETNDGKVKESGVRPYEERPAADSPMPNLLSRPVSTKTIYSTYSYPIEGPASYRHVLLGTDGTLMIQGHSPFFRYDATPSLVVIAE